MANGKGPERQTKDEDPILENLALWPFGSLALSSPVPLLATIAIMNYYDMWVNIKDSRKDLEFAEAVRAYLDYLKGQGMIAGWTLKRRKFGFGPESLGEFNITVWAENLAQLDAAFSHVATRSGEVERLHIPVYAAVTDFKSALWRDFPDPERVRS
jgi:hypothetical protein